MAKVRLAVLFGGASKDHKVSLVSAYHLLNGLARDRYDVTPIGITKAGRWLYFPGDYEEILQGTWEQSSDCCSAIISPDPLHSGVITIMGDGSTAIKRIDAVLSVLHGKYGEGGRIQGLLKLARLPHTDSDPETAMYCMDKGLTHLVLSNAGIDVPNYALLERGDLNVIDERIAEIEKKFRYPVYISASSCSSSIGANIVYNAEELKKAAKIAFSHHHKAIVEEELSGRNIECAVMGSSYDIEISAFGEIVKTPGINTAAAYTAEFDTSPDLTDEQRERMTAMAKKAFLILCFRGCARMSFRICGERIMLRRVAAIPGFAPESALMLLLRESGYEYSGAINKIVSLATELDA